MTRDADVEARMDAYRKATADRNGLVRDALAAGYSQREISKRTGISRPTVINIARQQEREMAAAKRFAVGDEVRYQKCPPVRRPSGRW